jgi:hypothetical protein
LHWFLFMENVCALTSCRKEIPFLDAVPFTWLVDWWWIYLHS